MENLRGHDELPDWEDVKYSVANRLAKEYQTSVIMDDCPIIIRHDDDVCNAGHMDCPFIHRDKFGNHADCKHFETDNICFECHITGT